jgi:hypothetical protein
MASLPFAPPVWNPDEQRRPALVPQAAVPLPPPTIPTAPLMGAQQPLQLPGAVLPNIVHSQKLDDVAELNRLKTTGSGISQIQNPWLRGVARVADTVGRIVAPNVERVIGGTEGKHQVDLQKQQGLVTQDQANDTADANTSDMQAQALQRAALATQEQAKAESLLHPVAKPLPPHYENLAQEHADAVMAAIENHQDPSTDPKVKAVEDAIARVQPEHAGKTPNKDDQFISIQQKIAKGEPLTPEEKAYLPAYKEYVKLNKIDPAQVRVQALMQMPQAIVDPNDPSREIFSTKKGAIGQEAPGSGEAAAARRMDTYMTSGKGGQTLNSFNTATKHLDLLDKTADALKNGNLQIANSVGQSYAKATGNPAPTNFDALRLAVSGEVGKTFSGGVATVPEMEDLKANINKANSPAQLKGVINDFRQLMQSKRETLETQYKSGIQGKADFGSSTPATPTATHKFNPATGRIEVK